MNLVITENVIADNITTLKYSTYIMFSLYSVFPVINIKI